MHSEGVCNAYEGACNALRGREGWGGTELGVNQGVNVDRHMGAAELGRIYTKNDPDLHVHGAKAL